jgi:PAT family acetyl-CoA transporter-like MFS transporter 1
MSNLHQRKMGSPDNAMVDSEDKAKSNNVPYNMQTYFTLVSYPFSLKMLWAPLVDSIYIQSFGRRKSWLVPTQLLIAAVMFVMGGYVDSWLGTGEHATNSPDVETLTAVFFFLFFLCATQDIAVDGWAITMLSKENTGWQATCNTVGQNLGIFLSYIGFMVLTNEEICNNHLRSTPAKGGIATLPGLVMFWGWVFLLTTLYVWFFKPEKAFKAPATTDAESGTELLKASGGKGGGDGDDDEGGEDEEYLTISEAFRQFRLVFLVKQIT